MGRGSPICERVKRLWNILKTTFLHAKLQMLCKSHHLQCITSSKNSEKLCVCKGLRALRCYCITQRHDSIIDINIWAQEYFQKPISVNTICCAICRYQIELYHAKMKQYVNKVQKHHRVLWAKAYIKFKMGKWKSVYGQTSTNLTFLLKITDAMSSGLKRMETIQHVINVEFKT